MITRPFRHEHPTSIEAATALLEAAGDEGRVLSGGTWLVPDMVSGAASPAVVIDLRGLRAPAIERVGDELVLSARATYADVLASSDAAELTPLLVTMAAGVTGGAQLRNVATLAGSACQATPSSDVPGCLVALGARMRIAGPNGMRELSAAAFFLGAQKTALERHELLAEIVIERHAEHGYVKLKHSAGSWPIATASALRLADGSVRLVLGAVAATPLAVEGDDLVGRVTRLLVEPWSDALADGDYRRSVAPVMARRALERLSA
jgi:carbon-monoxide dehydrogenase medium subunit